MVQRRSPADHLLIVHHSADHVMEKCFLPCALFASLVALLPTATCNLPLPSKELIVPRMTFASNLPDVVSSKGLTAISHRSRNPWRCKVQNYLLKPPDVQWPLLTQESSQVFWITFYELITLTGLPAWPISPASSPRLPIQYFSVYTGLGCFSWEVNSAHVELQYSVRIPDLLVPSW